MSDDEEANNVTELQVERALHYGIMAIVNRLTGVPGEVCLTRSQRRKQIEEAAERYHPPGERTEWIKEQIEIDDELRNDPVVLRTGKVSQAAWKRARRIVEDRFTNKAAKLLEDINRLLENDKWPMVAARLEYGGVVPFYDLSTAVTYIDSVLKDLTPEELQLVDDIAKALARLGKRAEGWSVRLMPSKRQRASVVQLVKGEEGR